MIGAHLLHGCLPRLRRASRKNAPKSESPKTNGRSSGGRLSFEQSRSDTNVVRASFTSVNVGAVFNAASSCSVRFTARCCWDVWGLSIWCFSFRTTIRRLEESAEITRGRGLCESVQRTGVPMDGTKYFEPFL